MSKPTITHSGSIPETKQEDSGSSHKGRLSADEFNEFTQYVKENSDNINTINNNTVYGVRMPGGEPIYPDSDGIVQLTSSSRSVNVLVKDNQSEFVFYSKNDAKLYLAATASNGSTTLAYPIVISIYIGETLKKTIDVTGSTGSTTTYTEVDISDIIEAGSNNLTLSAYCSAMKLTSDEIPIVVTYTNISITAITNWTNIINVQGTNPSFTIEYNTTGSVSSDLKRIAHLKIYSGTQATGTPISKQVEITSSSVSFSVTLVDSEITTYGSHGVHLIEAYIEVVDSNDSVIFTSSTTSNRFMFARDTTNLNDFIVVQDLASTIDNYTSGTIFEYYVFKPVIIDGVIRKDETTNIDVRFGLTYMQSGQRYSAASQLMTITAGTKKSLELQPEAISQTSNEPTSYQAYPTAIEQLDDDVEYDLLTNSGFSATDIVLTIVNNASVSPNKNPSFVLNPKLYTSEDNGTIRNDKDVNHDIVASTWNIKGEGIDGYIDNVLRLVAGDTISIDGFKPFSVYGYNSSVSTDDKSATIEMQLKMYNVTDESNMAIKVAHQDSDGSYKGITIYPMQGYVYTKTSNSKTKGASTNQNFQWREDDIIHIIINICPNVSCNYGDNNINTSHSLALVRVLLDGVLQREFVYNNVTPQSEWTEEDYQLPYDSPLVLGCESADMDIYSIRCYEGTPSKLTCRQLFQDYIAIQSDTNTKIELYNKNDLTYESGHALEGRISVDKAKTAGLNVLIWHGSELKNAVTTFDDKALTSTNDGWWEIFVYNEDGSLDERHSGTICKTRKIKGAKSQGTTAKTYYYHNIQTKIKPNKGDDNKDTVSISYLTGLDTDFVTASDPYTESGVTYVDLSGTYSKKKVKVTDGNIDVGDGWFYDGKYRGQGYEVYTNTPFANKFVNKINYASSMQSHLQGGVLSYNDLHENIVGNTLGRAAKCVRQFLFFIQDDSHDYPIYRGLCTFGSGKADDATWGYTDTNGLCMIEGATNNAPLADMRVPWDDEVTNSYYDNEQDGWLYNGTANIDLDKVKFDTDGDYSVCNADTLKEIKAAFNYLYWHNPNIKYTTETREAFIITTKSSEPSIEYNKDYSYCTSDYYLMRYDYVNQIWVDAGFKGDTLDTDTNSYYQKRLLNLSANPGTDSNYNDYEILNGKVNWALSSLDPDTFVDSIRYAYADHAKGKYNGGSSEYGLDQYFNIDSLIFHYAYVNYFIAGTDNCSKNTYYVFVPKDVSDLSKGHIIEMHQDDLDTIFMTDNSGNQTKPYYIDRTHPYPDGSTESCYEGSMNVLFNLTELMFGERYDNLTSGDGHKTVRLMLQSIFKRMQSVSGSIWEFIDSYFFDVQKYFPEIAWNEQGMVRYEYPHAIGASGRDGVLPISQSIGSQLQSEMYYMTRRIVLAASYAGFGELGGATDEKIGINDCAAAFGAVLTNGKTATYKVTAFQYIYPAYNMGDARISLHTRLAPGESLTIPITSSTNDRYANILGANYYSSMGDLGGSELSGTFSGNGKRLIEFIVDESDSTTPKFTASPIDVTNMYNLRTFSIKGCTETTPQNLKVLKLLTKLELNGAQFSDTTDIPTESLTYLDLRGTTVTNLSLSDCSLLSTLYVPTNCTTLSLTNCPKLSTIVFESTTGNLTTIKLDNCQALTSIILPKSVKSITLNNCNNLTSICDINESGALSNLTKLNISLCSAINKTAIINRFRIDGAPVTTLYFDTFTTTAFSYDNLEKLLSIANITTGTSAKSWVIDMAESTSSSVYGMKFSTKVAVLNKFGAVDSESNNVYITYKQTTGLSWSIAINGSMYTRTNSTYTYTLVPSSENINHFTSFDWVFDGPYPKESATANIKCTTKDSITNTITVNAQGENNYVLITGKANLTTGGYTSFTQKKVYLWNREAVLGDFVYADGDYSDEYDSSRTVVGICVYTDTDTSTQKHSGLAQYKHRRLCVAIKDISLNGTYGTYTFNNLKSLSWGVFSDVSSATSENENRLLKSNGTSSWVKYTLASDSTYDMYDTPLPNFTSYGGKTLVSPSYYIYAGNYTDSDSTTQEYTSGTSFYPCAYNTGWGDGFYEGESDSYAQNNRALTSDLLNLTRLVPGDDSSHTEYSEGDIVSSGYINTLKIILHRNKILQDENITSMQMGGIPSASGTITELDALGNAICQDRYMAETTGITSYPNKYWQLHYPAASACYAYEPTVKTNETLDAKFRRHNWFLPSEGILARMQWYVLQTGGINDGIHYNIFTKANTELGNIWPSSTTYWSSTEYGSNYSWYSPIGNGPTNLNTKYPTYYVRAVAAF